MAAESPILLTFEYYYTNNKYEEFEARISKYLDSIQVFQTTVEEKNSEIYQKVK